MTSYYYSINIISVTIGLGLFALHLTAQFGAPAAALFLLTTLAALSLRAKRLLEDAFSNSLLWVFILYCTVSLIWSPAPGITLRTSVQLAITFAFAITAASAMSTTAFLKTVLWVSLFVALIGLAIGNVSPSGSWTGVFRSKNDFAQFSASTLIAGFAGMLGGVRRNISLLSLACFGLSAVLLVKADSAGALIAALGACLAMVGIKTLGCFGGFARLFWIALIMLLLVFLTLLITLNLPAAQQLLLETTGKEATLTGRTQLWSIAFDEIAQRPLFGTGFKGYWILGNQTAERLWDEFGIVSKQGFHFHNTIISNAVEIGIVGTGLMIALFGVSFYRLLFWAIVDPCAETFYFAGLMVFTLVLMNSEVMFFSQFHKQTALIVAAMAYATRLRGAFSQDRSTRARYGVASITGQPRK